MTRQVNQTRADGGRSSALCDLNHVRLHLSGRRIVRHARSAWLQEHRRVAPPLADHEDGGLVALDEERLVWTSSSSNQQLHAPSAVPLDVLQQMLPSSREGDKREEAQDFQHFPRRERPEHRCLLHLDLVLRGRRQRAQLDRQLLYLLLRRANLCYPFQSWRRVCPRVLLPLLLAQLLQFLGLASLRAALSLFQQIPLADVERGGLRLHVPVVLSISRGWRQSGIQSRVHVRLAINTSFQTGRAGQAH